MRRPRPLKSVAFLVSAGYERPRATRHIYIETAPATLKDGQKIWEHIFACEESGVKRRWGYEARLAPVAAEAN